MTIIVSVNLDKWIFLILFLFTVCQRKSWGNGAVDLFADWPDSKQGGAPGRVGGNASHQKIKGFAWGLCCISFHCNLLCEDGSFGLTLIGFHYNSLVLVFSWKVTLDAVKNFLREVKAAYVANDNEALWQKTQQMKSSFEFSQMN